jgi:hypothetical protein
VRHTEKHYQNSLELSDKLADKFNLIHAKMSLFEFINLRALKTLSIETPYGYESIDISMLPEYKRKYLTYFIKYCTVPYEFGGDYECYRYILNNT